MRLIAYLILGAASAPLFAQPTDSSLAPTTHRLNIQAATEHVLLPALDNKELAEMYDSSGEEVSRFAHARWLTLDKDSRGRWTPVRSGRVWRLKVTSPNALEVRAVMSRFWLPEGATLHVMDAEEKKVFGAFTARHNRESGRFVTPRVPGESFVLEYFEPKSVEPGIITLQSVIHTYSNALCAPGVWPSPYFECHQPINCAAGDPWRAERDAALMVRTLLTCCSGTLLNNVEEDQRNLILTAKHCDTDLAYDDWEFIFHKEWKNCPAYDYQGDTTDISVYTGADHVAGFGGSRDFLLLELQSSLANDSVTYSGWNNTNTLPTYVAGIHHPNSAAKRLSTSNDIIGAVGLSWDAEWDAGDTEGGSSGSGLWNQDHHLIGQLNGGYGGGQKCSDESHFSSYPKLWHVWNASDEHSEAFREALNPYNRSNYSVRSLANHDLTVSGTYNDRNTDMRWGFYRTVGTITVEPTTVNDRLEMVTGESVIFKPGFVLNNGGTLTLNKVPFGGGPPAAKAAVKITSRSRDDVAALSIDEPWSYTALWDRREISLQLDLIREARVIVQIFALDGRRLASQEWRLPPGKSQRSLVPNSQAGSSGPIVMRLTVLNAKRPLVEFMNAEVLRPSARH